MRALCGFACVPDNWYSARMEIRLRNPIPLPLASLAPLPEQFTHPSGIHGQAHVSRVIVHAFLLVDLLGLGEKAPAVWAAAHIHDLGRRHDGACPHHGQYALDKVKKMPELLSLLAAGGVAAADWEGVSVAVKNHCRGEIPEDHPHRTLTAVLKDADGLDRVRLGDLDLRYLRFPESRKLAPFAEALFRKTDRVLRPGPEYFPALWNAAHRLQGAGAGTAQ